MDKPAVGWWDAPVAAGTGMGLAAVSVLSVDPDQGARESIRAMLRTIGFRDIATGVTLHDLTAGAGMADPDLILCDLGTEGGDVCRWLRDLRHRAAAGDPFVPVIVTAWEPTPQLVRRAVDAGADHLLSKPFSAEVLAERVRDLLVGGRPFVVSGDYVGPDRRRSADRPATGPFVAVPNRLQARVLGTFDAAGLAAMAAEAQGRIDRLRIDVQTVTLVHTAEAVVSRLAGGYKGPSVMADLAVLRGLADDAEWRLTAEGAAVAADLCRQLREAATMVGTNIEAPPEDVMARLVPLARAMQADFHGGRAANGAPPPMPAGFGGEGALFDADTAARLIIADGHPDQGERPQRFLLRLLAERIAPLLYGPRAPRGPMPHAFLDGLDDFLLILLGAPEYGALNELAADLLTGGEGAAGGRELLCRLLGRFRTFERGQRNFLAAVNSALTESLKRAGWDDGRVPLREAQFALLFEVLFAEVIDDARSPDGRRRLAAAAGADAAAAAEAVIAAWEAGTP